MTGWKDNTTMATPIENAQFLQNLSAPGVRAFDQAMTTRADNRRYEEEVQRRQEQANLRRMQELENQSAEATLRTNLTNLGITAQERIENSRSTRDDNRALAADKRATDMAVRAAYVRYKNLGGTKKMKEFGDSEDKNTVFAIEDEAQRLDKETSEANYVARAKSLKDQEAQLLNSLNPSAENRQAMASQVIDALELSDAYKAAAKFYKSNISKGNNSETAIAATVKKYPEFAQVVAQGVSSKVDAYRRAQAESPEAKSGFKAWGDARNLLMASALKDSVYSQAFWDGIGVKAPDSGGPVGNVSKFVLSPEKAGGNQLNNLTPPPSSGYGGALGLTEGLRPALSGGIDNLKLSIGKRVEPVAQFFNRIAGGEKRVAEGDAERAKSRAETEQSMVRNLLALNSIRNQQPTAPQPAVMPALAQPQPMSNPVQGNPNIPLSQSLPELRSLMQYQ